MNLTAKDVTPAVKSAVNAYLMARARAEVLRSKVDKIHRQILTEIEFYNDLEVEHGKAKERITEPKYTYLCEDKAALERYFLESDKRERLAGLKPDDMPVDHCPACTAEWEQTQIEWLMLDCASEMLHMDIDGQELNHRLLCKGLETRQQFIDLIVKLVINLPDFRNPLTRKAA